MKPMVYSTNDVGVIVSRHTHDVRNALNGMELELALLAECHPDPGLRDAVKRLRDAGGQISKIMQSLSLKYMVESPSVLPAMQICERWHADARHLDTTNRLRWDFNFDDECVFVESGLIRSLLKDSLELSLRINSKSAPVVNGRREGALVVFEILADFTLSGQEMIDSNQAYWAALRALGERSEIRMSPQTLHAHEPFAIQLTVPVSLR